MPKTRKGEKQKSDASAGIKDSYGRSVDMLEKQQRAFVEEIQRRERRPFELVQQ
jgi:hypothetical protein